MIKLCNGFLGSSILLWRLEQLKRRLSWRRIATKKKKEKMEEMEKEKEKKEDIDLCKEYKEYKAIIKINKN